MEKPEFQIFKLGLKNSLSEQTLILNMPFSAFFFLTCLFLIGTMANIAGNAYGNYLMILAMIIFSGWMLVWEIKKEFNLNRKKPVVFLGKCLYLILLAAYLLALCYLKLDGPYSGTLYFFIGLLLIFFRCCQILLFFFFFIFQRVSIREYGKLLVFFCIDAIFLAEVVMEEMQLMEMQNWRHYTLIGFSLMNIFFIIHSFVIPGKFWNNFHKRYPAGLGLSFYLVTIFFVAYQTGSQAGYLPKFTDSETCYQEAELSKNKKFERLSIMKLNLNSFWKRNENQNRAMSLKIIPFKTCTQCEMDITFNARDGITWKDSATEKP